MPVRSCALLGSVCKANETCAVVTEDGKTGCVAVGTATEGKSCVSDHCAENLTCLGQPSARVCFRVCRVSAADTCPTGKRCRGSAPLFNDPDFGICESDGLRMAGSLVDREISQ
jgi:hypothetical protein